MASLLLLLIGFISAADSGWVNFNTQHGACIENNGNYPDNACAIEGGYCGCSASGFGANWILPYPAGGAINGNGYRFLCQGSNSDTWNCNLILGTGVGRSTGSIPAGDYYISFEAEYDNGASENNHEILRVGLNTVGEGWGVGGAMIPDLYISGSSPNAVKKCVFRNPGTLSGDYNIWAIGTDTGSVHMKRYRISTGIPDDVTTYCDDGTTFSRGAGYVDGFNVMGNCKIHGWAKDGAIPNTAREVHLYFDGPSSNGMNTGLASLYRSDGGIGYHGFEFSLAGRGLSVGSHTVWGYSFLSSGTPFLLGNSGGSFSIPSETCNGVDDDCNGVVDNGNLCPSGQVCSSGSCTTIICSSNSQCGTNSWEGALTCSGNNVMQNFRTYTCNNPGTASSSCSSSVASQVKSTCSGGQVCSSGTCVTPTCSSNSQCGTNDWEGSPFCSGNSVFQNYKTWTCNNPGTLSSSCSSTSTSTLKITCSGGQICSGGTCVNPTCSSNSQCGTNDWEGALTCSGNNVTQNYRTFTCNSPGTTSSSCSSSVSSQTKQICSGVTPVCSVGVCVNPTCSLNSDCGTNTWEGALTCSGNNVTQNFRTYTCNNPGTPSSSCSSSVLSQVNLTCSGTTPFCSSGVCVTAPDITAPTISFVSPTDSSSTINRTNIQVNITASDNVALSNITIRLYNSTGSVNSTTSATSPHFINFITLLNGTYYFNATACDTSNNCANTETRTITVNTSSSGTQTCTSFTYSSWSPAACPSSETQTRTITSQSPSGCTGGSPESLTRSCTHSSTHDDDGGDRDDNRTISLGSGSYLVIQNHTTTSGVINLAGEKSLHFNYRWLLWILVFFILLLLLIILIILLIQAVADNSR